MSLISSSPCTPLNAHSRDLQSSHLLLLAGLEVLERKESSSGTDQHDSVDTNTEAARARSSLASISDLLCSGLGLWVARLVRSQQARPVTPIFLPKSIPVSSSFRPIVPPESPAPRHCGRRPQRPRWHPGHLHQAEPPLHPWIAPYLSVPTHLTAVGKQCGRETYGCSSTKLPQS